MSTFVALIIILYSSSSVNYLSILCLSDLSSGVIGARTITNQYCILGCVLIVTQTSCTGLSCTRSVQSQLINIPGILRNFRQSSFFSSRTVSGSSRSGRDANKSQTTFQTDSRKPKSSNCFTWAIKYGLETGDWRAYQRINKKANSAKAKGCNFIGPQLYVYK